MPTAGCGSWMWERRGASPEPVAEDSAASREPPLRNREPPVNPIAQGTLLAALAAVLFGVATPMIRWAGTDAGAFPTAVLLYAGAALATLPLPLQSTRSEPPVRRRHMGRLLIIALIGGALAPASFAWGLQRIGGTSASLLLNFEAIFTAVVAWGLYGEALGARAFAALGFMSAGGAVLGLTTAPADDGRHGGIVWGAAAVIAATLGWALDNALTRPLADLDPIQVVRGKGLLGGIFGLVAATTLRQSFPTASHAGALLMCGALGYGLSLRLYLLAQRRIGAARTGSLFALAPFVGAAVAWAVREGSPKLSTMTAGALFGFAVYLHATETHRHRHTHLRIGHEHAHRHDDDHHDHPHEPPIIGPHCHFHTHDDRTHEHAHGPDIHHGHHRADG